MATVGTILEIVLVGLKFLDRADQDSIRNKILDFRSKYASELSKPFRPMEPGENYNEDTGPVDNAKLYSLERELRDILQLYSTSVQRTAAPAQS